jgi:hypothetical protein
MAGLQFGMNALRPSRLFFALFAVKGFLRWQWRKVKALNREVRK